MKRERVCHCMSYWLCFSCLLGGLHAAVWPRVCQQCQSDDEQLVNKCRQLRQTDLSTKMLPAAFNACDLTAAVSRDLILECERLQFVVLKGKGKVNHAPQDSIGGCSSPSSRP